MDPILCKRIMEKNAEHNLKSSERLLLISKQGVLFVTPSARLETSGSAERSDLQRIHDLVEIALVCGVYLDNFRNFRLENEDVADFFLSKIRTLIEKPDFVFRESVTNRLVWIHLCNEFVLKQNLQHVTSDLIDAISEKSVYFNQYAEWWKQNDFGHLLSKTILDAGELHLGFIDDPDFKRMIIEDYIEARRSLASKNYKAAIVLCGSIAEALLIFVLVRKAPTLDPDKLYRKGFDELAKKAKDDGILADTSLLSLLDTIRLYRNMIHPGRTKRLGLTADPSKARIAFEAVNLLVSELNKHCTTVHRTP
jgi:hypothetical protein